MGKDKFEYDNKTKTLKLNDTEIFKVKSYNVSSSCDWGNAEKEKKLLTLEIYVDEINIK